jgi:hypothetical protein
VRPAPGAIWGISRAPAAADTIGGTTGISQPPNAASGSTLSWVNIRNGIVAAVNSPPTVPADHNTHARSTATRSPIRSLPTSSAPEPTVINAIGAAP